MRKTSISGCYALLGDADRCDHLLLCAAAVHRDLDRVVAGAKRRQDNVGGQPMLPGLIVSAFADRDRNRERLPGLVEQASSRRLRVGGDGKLEMRALGAAELKARGAHHDAGAW